ncbi:MAG TPA: hypothetical protein VJ617_10045 [Arthrobacter sp.]|nr:hypothetical protein [Arthrobacter sp.]
MLCRGGRAVDDPGLLLLREPSQLADLGLLGLDIPAGFGQVVGAAEALQIVEAMIIAWCDVIDVGGWLVAAPSVVTPLAAAPAALKHDIAQAFPVSGQAGLPV